ncbi:MAG: hypothetical protein OEW58_10305 [Gammaproteobacteria bacterium]|nr:hypothetical protein [Gammaproteobacteria bacterium]
MEKIDWKDLVFNQIGLEKIDRLSFRRFGQSGLAEEASAYVIERLSDNNWEVLSSFQGQSKPDTYLYTIISNLIEEFSRKRFGRPRPPEWLKRQGDLWLSVWRMVCLERQEAPVVVSHLSHKEQRDPGFVQSVIVSIKARLPWCGQSSREISACFWGDDEEEIEVTLPDYQTPDQLLLQKSYTETLYLMSMILNSEPDAEKLVAGNEHVHSGGVVALRQKLEKLKSELHLSDEEVLVLKMVYQDGLKRNFVASALNMQAHMPGRIATRALDKIRQAFSALDIDLNEIRELTA